MSERVEDTEGLGRTAFELKRLWESGLRICPLCRFVATGVEQRIDALFYENVNDAPTRDAIRAAGGFCRYHTRLIVKQADALGTAIILQDVLTNDLRALDAGEFEHPSATSNPLARVFQTASPAVSVRDEIQCPPCPICDTEGRLEEMAIDGLLEALGNTAALDSFSHSEGLCVPHFHLAFSRSQDDERWATILETEKRGLKNLTWQLSELARKHDYRFKDEPRGEEMRSWRRALNASSGWVED